MYEFMELVGYIWAALMDAQDMAHEAIENKHDHPDLAAAYYRIANDRVNHAEALTKQASDCLELARRNDVEDLDEMQAVWTADHGRLVKQMTHTKIMMDMYRG